jgi:acyl carrier protein
MLASAWQELLHVERVGRNDHFFELGGHSLLAMQVVTRIRSSFSVDMPVGRMFQYPTLRDMAAEVEAMRHASLLAAISERDDGSSDLLDIVAAMSDAKVGEMVRELTRRGTL